MPTLNAPVVAAIYADVHGECILREAGLLAHSPNVRADHEVEGMLDLHPE